MKITKLVCKLLKFWLGWINYPKLKEPLLLNLGLS